MAKGKKAKWLEVTTRELIVLLKSCIKEEDFKKANKIINELLERTPEEDGNMTIEGAVQDAIKSLQTILDIYNQEVSSITDEEDEDEEEEEEKPVKKKRSKKSKKKAEPEPEEDEDEEEDDDEDDEEDEEDDEDEAGYDEMTQGELKKELRRRGIKVTKSMKKADMVRALEADDEE